MPAFFEAEFWSLANPELWVGVVVGAVFIAAAIWLRQRRDDT